MQERQQMIDRFFVFGESQYSPHIDYTRTRGLISQIINQVDEIDNEIQLAEDAKLTPPAQHAPRKPVGTYEPELSKDELLFMIGPNGEEQPYNTNKDHNQENTSQSDQQGTSSQLEQSATTGP